MVSIQFGILTVSDSCSKDKSLDKSGPELQRLVTDASTEIGKILKGQVRRYDIVADDTYAIKATLVSWADKMQLDVILTTGGTGFSKRDVTPEATENIIEKEAPGLALSMMISSLKITPMAALSRAVCGIRGRTLIINLPGSPKAARECLAAVASTIPHVVDIIRNNETKIKSTHAIVQDSHSHSCSHHHAKETLGLENVAKRSRESPYPMISVDEALKLLSKHAVQSGTESVPVRGALGRILSENIHSKYDLPPFRASIKDGYAVLANDGKGVRKVLCGVPAGTTAADIKLAPGCCVRVNTGAPVPDDATAVVQVEDTKLVKRSADEKEEMEIEIMTEVKHGQDIRPIGCDIQKNELILKCNTKLGSVELGLLEACGYSEVLVKALPVVGVLSTGDELQSTGTPLLPGHVYDSNKITLLSILKEQGLDGIDLGIAKDNETSMVEAIRVALEKADVIITSGSVSMGDKDLLKPVLQHHFKATIHFGRVNMKPGKPTTFATCTFNGQMKYLLCLPGNPVSATVTMHLFVLPLLDQLCGDDCQPVYVKARLTSSYNLDPRPEYARAVLKWDEDDVLPKAYSTGDQISSKLSSCRNANALLMLPGRTKERISLHSGDEVQAMLFRLKRYD